MRKFILGLFLLIGYVGISQCTPMSAGCYLYKKIIMDSSFRLPPDTLKSAEVGSIARKGNAVYFKRNTKWVAITADSIAGNTIYTGDGVLSGNRVVNGNNKYLYIDSASTFKIDYGTNISLNSSNSSQLKSDRYVLLQGGNVLLTTDSLRLFSPSGFVENSIDTVLTLNGNGYVGYKLVYGNGYVDSAIYATHYFVDSSIAASTPLLTLQNVTDNGNTTTNDIEIGNSLNIKNYLTNFIGGLNVNANAISNNRSYDLPDSSGTLTLSVNNNFADSKGNINIPTIDTTSLNDRINLKVNIADTSSMLSPYLRKFDTTVMLSPYKTFYPRTAISLTTIGTSGAATYNNSTGVLNVPQYAGTSYTFSTGLTNTSNTITNNLSTGVSGGQTAYGGTASGNNLTLSSTSDATKGKLLFGTSAYDEVNNRLGIGTTSPANRLEIAAGTMTDQVPNMKITATMPTTLTGTTHATFFDITGAGSSNSFNTAMRINYNAGYTGANICSGLSVVNANAGTGNDLRISAILGSPLGNSGFLGFATGNSGGAGAGLTVGGFAEASGGATNIGMYAKSISNLGASSSNNIGVLGIGQNTASGSPIQIGGYFGLNTSTPTFSSAALMADNGSTTSNIFTARDNGTNVFQIIDGGAVGIGTTPSAVLHLKAGTSSASTAPLKFTAGTVNTTVESGAVETDANNDLYYTNSTGRSRVGLWGYSAKTTTYTITNSDNTIDCTSGTFTVTLPTAVGFAGRKYIIKNSGSGTITLATTSSQTIDGATTKTMNVQYSCITVQSTGANWIIISNF